MTRVPIRSDGYSPQGDVAARRGHEDEQIESTRAQSH